MSAPTNLRHIIVPGFQNSNEEHWQSRWQAILPNTCRTQPQSWDHPEHDDWVEALDRAVNEFDAPVILVAHSLGCITTGDWATTHDCQKVIGAMLVAIPDVFRKDFPLSISGYDQPLLKPLPFPSLAVLSSNDPYCTIERGRMFADSYGAQIAEVGAKGHINHESDLGDWPIGIFWLAGLSQKAA